VRRALAALILLPLAGAAAAQPARCAASSDTPRSAREVIAAVAAARCEPGSRLDVAMTVAGQAIELQQSGLCQPESVRTMTRRPTPETRVLGFSCLLAAR
jgi:hypothetical protein